MVNLKRMQEQLVLHEGLRLEPYQDTEGHWTVLVGYNIDARGWDAIERALGREVDPTDTHFTEADAMLVLAEDIQRYWKAMLIVFPEVVALSEVRQRVCLDMAFNMGYSALGFKATIAAIKKRDWSTAAREMHKSKWARQVGIRCDRLAHMLLTNEDYRS